MAKKFKLTNLERTDCAQAVILGSGKGFTINDKLDEIEDILNQLLMDAIEVNGRGSYNFETCNEGQELNLKEKQFARLINDLRTHPWKDALKAREVKKLVTKLEDVPPCQDTEK